jgi:parvulin-like peptidyl-prolyl isomerase
MTDLQTLLSTVDQLTPAELDALYRYVEKRRQQLWWVISSSNMARLDDVMRPVQDEASHMTDAEIDEAINQAIAEVRDERNQQAS